MADQSGDQPTGPKNKKNRPFAAGTTSPARKEARAQKQWSALEKADPSSPRRLVEHLAALEKARAKCEARLKEELAAKGGIRSPLVQEGNQANPAPAKKAKAAAAARGGSKSRGKNGQARSSLEKQPGQQDVEMSTSAEQGKVLEPSQKQLDLEKSGQKGDGLEKSTPQESNEQPGLEKSSGSAASGEAFLAKAAPSDDPADGLEKSTASSSGLEKPNVIVDWHFTLEVNDQVSDDNIKALEVLVEKCKRVTLLSYVASNQRAQQVQKDMQDLLPGDLYRRLGKAICWKKTGPGGKCDKSWAKQAAFIFDDNKEICQECLRWGIQPFPINGPHQQHAWARKSYDTFSEAVSDFLASHPEL